MNADILGLLPFCNTTRQEEYVRAYAQHQSFNAAAKAMNTDRKGFSRRIKEIQLRAAMQGYAPDHDMVHTAPATHHVKGVSTLYTHGEDGQRVAAQWVKTDLSKNARLELLKGWVEDLADGVEGLKAPTKAPKPKSKDVLPAYVLGDPHVGMRAWNEEAGEDFDLEICTRHLAAAIDELVQSAPPADNAIIVNLGDYFHADTPENKTKASQAPLDVDGRHAKVFRVGCAVFERMIDAALAKHRKVTVYITKGNHDPESSFALAEVLRAVYRREKRVDIRGGIRWREYHQFGKCLIGITHGDKAKFNELPAIMAAERAEAWGQSVCRRWLVGHLHHQHRKEFPGCIVEIFPTLAAKDAWHASMGYLSERAMTCAIYHREHGEIGRRIVGVPELEAA